MENSDSKVGCFQMTARMWRLTGILFLFCYIFQMASFAQEYDFDVINILKRDNFNRSFYELSFCINEIHFILENDSNYFDVWKKRVQQIQTHENELSYMKIIEYLFFNEMQKNNPDNKYFPRATKFVQESQIKLNVDKPSNFARVFIDYIEYPEQVDDACLIMLICNPDCDYFTEIQNNEVSLWLFNNWLQYGFEEFRYFPALSNRGKMVITNRIIDYIFDKKDCIDKELVQKSKEMIKSVTEIYKIER